MTKYEAAGADAAKTEFLASHDLANRFIDELCSSAPFVPDKHPRVMLRALGVVACNVSLAFKIDLDDALAIVAKEARALEEFCREVCGEEIEADWGKVSPFPSRR
jgi:hypothetical protein